jgi:hypothetical protein
VPPLRMTSWRPHMSPAWLRSKSIMSLRKSRIAPAAPPRPPRRATSSSSSVPLYPAHFPSLRFWDDSSKTTLLDADRGPLQIPETTVEVVGQTASGVGDHAGPPLERLPRRHVDEVIYQAKSNELKTEAAKTGEALAELGDVDPARAETAMALFDWTQNAAEVWRGSNNRIRREILDAVCLNRTLSDANLNAPKRKPFDFLAERQ